MSSDIVALGKTADDFERLTVRIWTVQTELSRIGRLFRDRWAPGLVTLAGKAGAGTITPEELASLGNYRSSGKSASSLQELATALWMLHNLIDPDPPDPLTLDASKATSDIANLTTDWIDTAYRGTGNPLNEDIYNVCLELSRLGHEVWNAVQRYRAKVFFIIDRLSDEERDPATGRTGKQWRDCAEALDQYWRPFFLHLTKNGYGYGPMLLAF